MTIKNLHFRLVSQGFSSSSRLSTDSDNLSNDIMLPRLVVSSPLLLEFVHAIYHSLERGVNGATQTLHDVLQRAVYESFPGEFKIIKFTFLRFLLSLQQIGQ